MKGTITNLGIIDSYFCGSNGTSIICRYNQGTISNVYTSGVIFTNSGGIGGVVSENYGRVENCYSTAKLTVSKDLSYSYSNVVSYNYRGGSVLNCYFNEDVCTGSAVGLNYDGATLGEDVLGKTTEEFESGEVCYLLQSKQVADENGNIPVVWGQILNDEDKEVAPVLSDYDTKVVHKVTFATKDNANYAVRYRNKNSSYGEEFPEEPEVGTDYAFAKWSKTNYIDGEEFTSSSAITEDTTVYAIRKAKYGEDDTNDKTFVIAYGRSYEKDLSKYVVFSDKSSTANKFGYKILEISKDGNAITDPALIEQLATIDGDKLNLTDKLGEGSYTFTITVSEKEPVLSLADVDFGTDEFEFEINVIVKASNGIGRYADKVFVDRENVSDKVIFTITAVDGEKLPNAMLFLAEYDENNKITSHKIYNGEVVDGKLIITADIPAGENYKYMLWDNEQRPIVKAMTK